MNLSEEALETSCELVFLKLGCERLQFPREVDIQTEMLWLYQLSKLIQMIFFYTDPSNDQINHLLSQPETNNLSEQKYLVEISLGELLRCRVIFCTLKLCF